MAYFNIYGRLSDLIVIALKKKRSCQPELVEGNLGKVGFDKLNLTQNNFEVTLYFISS